MPRITCQTPASARPLLLRMASVPTAWTTLAEAPDFSVPDGSLVYPERDPLDAQRGIRPGEVFFLTPVRCRNKTGSSAWIELRLLTEAGTAVLMDKVTVPPDDTVYLLSQGFSLLKRVAAGSDGDRLQLRAGTATAFDVTAAAQEQPSAEHIKVVP